MGIFKDLYRIDRDLYIRDEKAIAEQYAFLQSKKREEIINFLKNNNNKKVINPQKFSPKKDCSETERFLPPGWEL